MSECRNNRATSDVNHVQILHVNSTYVLKMNVSLTGDVVRNVPDVLLPVAADEVLLRSSVLQRHTNKQKHFSNNSYLSSSAPLHTRAEASL